MLITALDHLVLTVADIPRSVDFYTRVLGMQKITFGEGRIALLFGQQKINLHNKGRRYYLMLKMRHVGRQICAY